MKRGAGIRQRGAAYEPQSLDKSVVAKSLGIDPEGEPDVYKFLSKALDFPLPEPWTEHADKKGRIFYWNPASRNSSWAHPLNATHKQLVSAFRRISKARLAGEDPQALVLTEIEEFHRQGEEEINQWRVSHAEDGTPYYYKTGTQQTRWDNPRDELVSHQELRIQMLSQLLEPDTAPEEERHQAIDHEQQLVECTEVLGLRMPGEAARLRANCPYCGSLNELFAGNVEIFEVNCALATCKRRFQGRYVVPTTSALLDDGRSQLAIESQENSRGEMDPKRSLGADFDKAARVNNSTTSSMKDVPGVSPILSPSPVGSAVSTPGVGMKPPLSRESSLDRSGRMQALSRALVPENLGYESNDFPSTATSAVGSRQGPRLMSGTAFEEAVKPELPSPLAATTGHVLARRGEEGTKSLYDGTNVDFVDPEVLALRLGLNFDDDVDRASFHILKPIITMPLPAPWRGIKRKTGRTDFYHPGCSENRVRHPLMGFFDDLLAFLREQSLTDTPLVGPLSAMVFKEASPQFVRQRLGVWEGPFEVVAGTSGGASSYERLLPGKDEACIEDSYRRDDPRVEAAANMMARIDAWYHLWNGFCPEEPFPFSEKRIPALVTQLSEAVVILPGDRADKETVLHQWNWELELRSEKVPRMEQPLLPEEEAVQHEVTALLGAAYGVALSVVAAHDAPYASNRAIALVIRKSVFRAAANRDFRADVVDAEEDEDTYEEDANEDEFEEESEGEGGQLSESEYDEESKMSLSSPEAARHSQASLDRPEDSAESDSEFIESPGSRRGNSIDMTVDLGAEADDEDQDMDESKIIAADDVGLFLQLDEDADAWAEFALRPLTPREKNDAPLIRDIRSPPASLMHRPKGFDEDVWATRNFLKGAVVKPFVSDLGWRCHLAITKGMWSEAEEEPTTVIDTALATSPWLVEAALSPSGQAPSLNTTVHTTLSATPRSTTQQGFMHSFDSNAPSVPPTPSQYRGIPLPPTALEQIRESNHAEIKTFKDMLSESANLFDKCLVQRQEAGTRPSTPLVAPYEDIEKMEDPLYPKPRSKYLMEKESKPRKALQRAHLPVRQKVNDDPMYDLPCKGCVPPVTSPQPTPRSGYPKPPYLTGNLKKNVWGLHRERPRSAERLPKEKRELHMKIGPRAGSADARARKARPGLLPEEKDIGAEVAVEELKFFFSRTCGTVEKAFKVIDDNGGGFVCLKEWVDGLQRLGYPKMEYAEGMFKILDVRKHFVLTLSDFLGKRSGSVYDGFPDPGLGSTMTDLLGEVLEEELEQIVKAALGDVMLSALRQPQPPIHELAVEDFNQWIKSKAKKMPKLKPKKKAEEQQSDDTGLEESLLATLQASSEGEDSKVGKWKKAGKSGSKMPKPSGEDSSASEKSNSSKEKSAGIGKKKKINLRSMGMLGKMLKDANQQENSTEEGRRGSPKRKAKTSKRTKGGSSTEDGQDMARKPSGKAKTSKKLRGALNKLAVSGSSRSPSKGSSRASSRSSRSPSERSHASGKGNFSSARSGSSRKGKRDKSSKSKSKAAARLAGKSGRSPRPSDNEGEEEEEESIYDESENASEHPSHGSRKVKKGKASKSKSKAARLAGKSGRSPRPSDNEGEEEEEESIYDESENASEHPSHGTRKAKKGKSSKSKSKAARVAGKSGRSPRPSGNEREEEDEESSYDESENASEHRSHASGSSARQARNKTAKQKTSGKTTRGETLSPPGTSGSGKKQARSSRQSGRSPRDRSSQGASPQPTRSTPRSTGRSFRSSSPGSTSQSLRPSGKKRVSSGPGSTSQSLHEGSPGSTSRSLRPIVKDVPVRRGERGSDRSLSSEMTRKPSVQEQHAKRASRSSKMQIGGSKSSSVPHRRKQPGQDIPGAILSTRLGPAPLVAESSGKAHRTKQRQQAWSESDMPNYGDADFSHQSLDDGAHGYIPQHQRRFPAKQQQSQLGAYPSSIEPRACFDVGYHAPVGGYPKPRPPELLPWCPRGPDEVCKTYSHIFKLLNDPQLKKKLPKPKYTVRMPGVRYISGGSSQPSARDEDDISSLAGSQTGSMRNAMIGSNSAPDLHVSTMDFDTGPSRVQLPPLAKSAPTKAHGPGGLLAGGMPPMTTVVSH